MFDSHAMLDTSHRTSGRIKHPQIDIFSNTKKTGIQPPGSLHDF